MATKILGRFLLLAVVAGLALAAWKAAAAWQHRTAGIRYFPDNAYHFQTLRALNDIRADGADTSEVLETVRHIRSGDAQGWFREWERTADRLLGQADGWGDQVGRGQAYLRAHNYLRTAEFFLPPKDEKRPASFARSVEVFYKGLDLLQVPYERLSYEYEGRELNAVYYPGPPGAERKPLIVFCGGYDSTLEELYFMLVRAAHERGYSVLTYEGPGQGSALREQGLTFIPEWEKPTGAMLDRFLKDHPVPPKMVLVGMSMGGYLAPRAAAFDRRFDGVVAFDVLYDFGEVADRAVPRLAWWLRDRGMMNLVDLLIRAKASLDPGFAWGVANGMWVMGTEDPLQTAETFHRYDLEPVADRIEADVLILAGERDHFIPVSQVERFKEKLTRARSVTAIVYDRESGGAEHCQLGAQALWHADFFSWMQARFP